MPDISHPYHLKCFEDWNVILRHRDGNANFNAPLALLKNGFDDLPSSEYYLGNHALWFITRRSHFMLRVDMWTLDGRFIHAEYSGFSLGSDEELYLLGLNEYVSGSAGDGGLVSHSGSGFFTPDFDTSYPANCSDFHNASWWYLENTNVSTRLEDGSVISSEKCFYSILTSPSRNKWAVMDSSGVIKDQIDLSFIEMRMMRDPDITHGI